MLNIPDDFELPLSTELPAFENAKPEFDPKYGILSITGHWYLDRDDEGHVRGIILHTR